MNESMRTLITYIDGALDKLVTYFGDNNEIAMEFSFGERKLYLRNTLQDQTIYIGSTFLNGNEASFGLPPQNIVYLDQKGVDVYGESSIEMDVGFTSANNIWSVNINNKCVSLETYQSNNDANLIMWNYDIDSKSGSGFVDEGVLQEI